LYVSALYIHDKTHHVYGEKDDGYIYVPKVLDN
jgi:hypothetical protein